MARAKATALYALILAVALGVALLLGIPRATLLGAGVAQPPAVRESVAHLPATGEAFAHPPAADRSSGLVYAEGERLMVDGHPFLMKGFNYLPRDYGWTALADWDWEEVDAELALAKEYGANTIRTGFDYPYTSGDLYLEHPFTEYKFAQENLEAIDKFVSLCDRHGLRAVLYIGGGPWGLGWDPANYWIIERRLQAMIPLFAGDPRIAAWDLCTDIDGTMLQGPARGGAYGTDPRATRENMVTLLCRMADTIRTLDPQHLLTVGYCWLSSSLLTQDCTDFLMPQFLGADAPNVLAADEEGVWEFYDEGWECYAADPEKGVDILADKIGFPKERLHRPMPIVLAEYGMASRGGEGFSEARQKTVYEAVLETAFLRAEIAGALSWVLTDFNWPPKGTTISWPQGLPETERSFGAFGLDYQPKPAAEVARAYYADHPEITLSVGPRYLDFIFSDSFVPAEENPGSEDWRELCAAFDWIEFRDASDQVLLKLDIGTEEARAYLRKGFYGDEGAWGKEADNFAWAGGEDKRAQVEVPFPHGAARLVFRTVTDLRVDVEVLVDGKSVDKVRLNPAWERSTVKLPSSQDARMGQPFMVHGAMNLPISKGTVTLQTSYDGTLWQDVARVVPVRGRFDEEVTFAHGGLGMVRASWSGAGYYGPAVSEPLPVKVQAMPTTLALSVPSAVG